MKRHLSVKYALYLSFYWMSACFVYGYTRLYMGQMGFSADEVGLLLGFNCGASMLLQPLLAEVAVRVFQSALKFFSLHSPLRLLGARYLRIAV